MVYNKIEHISNTHTDYTLEFPLAHINFNSYEIPHHSYKYTYANISDPDKAIFYYIKNTQSYL